jgi:hypothetical protein
MGSANLLEVVIISPLRRWYVFLYFSMYLEEWVSISFHLYKEAMKTKGEVKRYKNP